MPDTYFIADLHLAPECPARTRAFGDWLGDIRGCGALYILGDLFETWVGDDDDTPFAAEVRALLRQFSQSGAALYLMHGNRDFLLGPALCRATGATLLPDPSVVDLYGAKTLLMHGDSLCTRDVDYQALRARIRTGSWREEMLARPLAQRRALAQALRRVSHEALGNKSGAILDVSEDAVAAALRGHGVRRLIHGHTHRPGRHRHACGERWVLGDWGRQGWYLKATSSDFELVSFPINQ